MYNWVIALLHGRVHCTKFCGIISSYRSINASFVQGSGLDPSNFLITISGLKPLHEGNRLFKYADDCYLVIPASGISTTESELLNIEQWSKSCNLRLNTSKSCEIILTRPHNRLDVTVPPIAGIDRVTNLKILGVTLSQRIGFSLHINKICCSAKQAMFALRVLVSHGLTGNRLHDVVRSTIVARMLYSSPAWWGFVNLGERERLNSILRKLIKHGFLPSQSLTFEEICVKADRSLFSTILSDPGHVLHGLLPPVAYARCDTLYDHTLTTEKFLVPTPSQ